MKMKNYDASRYPATEKLLEILCGLDGAAVDTSEIHSVASLLESDELEGNELAAMLAKALVEESEKLAFLKLEQEYALVQLDQMQKELEDTYLALFKTQKINISREKSHGIDASRIRLLALARKNNKVI